MAFAYADICSRSPDVVEILSNEIEKPCGMIVNEDLAQIHELDLNGAVSFLKEGDFKGLVNLKMLDLSENDLASLPDTLFSDLPSLAVLALNDNQLTVLPEEIFKGLPLTALALDGNNLTQIPERLFQGQSSLLFLNLSRNQLSTLPEVFLKDVQSLRTLYIFENKFSDEEVVRIRALLPNTNVEDSE